MSIKRVLAASLVALSVIGAALVMGPLASSGAATGSLPTITVGYWDQSGPFQSA